MKVEKSIVINRPVEAVFAFVTEMNSVPRWAPVQSIRALEEGPVRVGATYVQVVDIMGKPVEIATEVTDYQPPRSFAFKSVSGPLPLTSTFTFVPSQDNTSTNLLLVGEAEPGGALKFAGPFLNNMVKKQIDDQLTALKRLLEAQSS